MHDFKFVHNRITALSVFAGSIVKYGTDWIRPYCDGDYEEAIKRLQILYGLISFANGADLICQTLFIIGDCYRRLDAPNDVLTVSGVGIRKANTAPESSLLKENMRQAHKMKGEDYQYFALENHSLLKDFDYYFPNIDRVYHGVAWTLGIEQKEPGFAIDLLLQGLDVCQELSGRCRLLHDLGDAYRAKAHWEKAIEFHKKAMYLAKNIRYTEVVAYSLVDIARPFIRIEEYWQAEKCLLKGIPLLRDDDYYSCLAYKFLFEIYEAIGEDRKKEECARKIMSFPGNIFPVTQQKLREVYK